MGLGALPTLTVNDARAIARDCPAVAAVTYGKRQVAQLVAGNQNWSTAIEGVTPEFVTVRDWRVAAGRFFTTAEDESAATGRM
jgi:hypothetical protein